MSYLLSDDERFLGSSEAYRSFLITRGSRVFARRSIDADTKRFAVYVRRAVSKTAKAVGGFAHRWAVAIAESKMRRIQRELALRGIHYSYPEMDKPAAEK